MRVTFLGHQGWMVELSERCLLIDPLLCPHMGQPGGRKAIYPPRQIDFTTFPEVDAVILSHEHEDHFDIPTLSLLDRRIPIYLPRRSSEALHTVVAEMGFPVHAVDAGDSVGFGDLEVFFLSPNHVKNPAGDEWDVLPHLVRDVRGSGSLFSSVDVDLSMQDLAPIRERVSRIGMWVLTNNVGNFGFQEGDHRAGRWDAARLALAWLSRISELEAAGFDISAFVSAGGGYSFPGDLETLNRVVFSADSDRVFQSLRLLLQAPLIHTLPGDSFILEGGKIVSFEHGRPFLSVEPRLKWPAREYVPEANAPDYGQATGQIEVTEAELGAIAAELPNLAAYFYGREIFETLAVLPPKNLAGLRREFALALRNGDPARRIVFVYRPESGAFQMYDFRDSRDPRQEFAFGMECWASDFLAFLRAELSQAAIPFGRMRSWSPPGLGVSVTSWIWMYGHPLQRPDSYLTSYRRILRDQAASAEDMPKVRCSSRVSGALRGTHGSE